MKIFQLIQLLQQYPATHDVHIEMNTQHERHVRSCAGVRIQDGFNAVAIDSHNTLRKREANNTK